jgi:hypothetical protein
MSIPMLFRVAIVSNYDEMLFTESWASEPMSEEQAELVAKDLNSKAPPNGPNYHLVVPSTYTLYSFTP